jgi:hypothetical protein
MRIQRGWNLPASVWATQGTAADGSRTGVRQTRAGCSCPPDPAAAVACGPRSLGAGGVVCRAGSSRRLHGLVSGLHSSGGPTCVACRAEAVRCNPGTAAVLLPVAPMMDWPHRFRNHLKDKGLRSAADCVWARMRSQDSLVPRLSEAPTTNCSFHSVVRQIQGSGLLMSGARPPRVSHGLCASGPKVGPRRARARLSLLGARRRGTARLPPS